MFTFLQFANNQWNFIQRKQSGCAGQCAEKIPDGLPLLWQNRVIVSEWPENKAAEFPPVYTSDITPRYEKAADAVPIISLGRLGTLTMNNRPADDAFLAMFDASKKIIRMSLQDLGPVCLPKTKIAVPGFTWPKEVLDALARAIWLRGVDLEIVLSNPDSIPGGLKGVINSYSHGWSCVDVAAEIIKRILKQFPCADDAELRKKVENNLRICFIRHALKNTYENGIPIGNHSKFFIIDDVAAYIGSQNLYCFDLAEWGVVVDDATETKKMIDDCWKPLWNSSYSPDIDCDVTEVMDGLKIDRDGEAVNKFSMEGWKQAEIGVRAHVIQSGSNMYIEEE